MDFPASPILSAQNLSKRNNLNQFNLNQYNLNYNIQTKDESFELKTFLDKSISEQTKMINDNPEIINYIDSQTGNNTLITSIEKNNYSLAKLILDKNPLSVDYQNKYNETALHKAVEIGNHKLINLLLEKNADPNIKNQFGETSLHIAASKGEYKVIKLLLLYNSDPNILSDDGYSAEDYANERGYVKCVEVLREKSKNQSVIINNNKNEKNNNVNYDLMTPKNKHLKIANGMEKSPISHQLSHRVFPSPRNLSKHLLHYNSLGDNNNTNFESLNKNNSELQYNNNHHNNLRESLFPNSLKTLSMIHKSLSGNVDDINEKYNIYENPKLKDIDNNIFLSSKEIIIPEETSFNNNEQDIKSPFQFANSIYIVNESNDFTDNKSEKNINLNESFCDNSEPIHIFPSHKNDIKCKELLRQTTRDSLTKYFRVNTTLRNTLKNSFVKNSIIEENASSEEFHLNNKNLFHKLSFNSEDTEIKENDEEALIEYLSQIHMDKYSDLLINNGFEDVKTLKELMKGKKGLYDIDLKTIGIPIAGDRARILIKVQLDVSNSEFKFNNFLKEESIFYITNCSEENFRKDYYLKELYYWLEQIKLQCLFTNFYNQGYYSVDLLLIQMLSKNPITEEMLLNDFKIKKYGYRLRLLNKLLEDSSQYYNKFRRLSTKSSGIDFENSERKSICQCYIY